MNCTICGKPVVLVPSAQERADKYGGTARDFSLLFPRHAQCEIDKREEETRALIRRLEAINRFPGGGR